MDVAGDEGGGRGPNWGWPTEGPGRREGSNEPTGGQLRRRAAGTAEAGQQAPDVAPLTTSNPGLTQEEEVGDLWSALTAIAQRVEGLSDATIAMRADMERSFADLAAALTSAAEQSKARFEDLESLTATPPPDLTSLTDAVTRVADLVETLARRVG